MSNRPYISFAEVKEKCPIPEVLEKLGIAEQFTRKGDTLTGVCPLPRHQHGPEPNDQQFKIDRKRGEWLWHCFGDCDCGGDVIELVKAIKGYDNSHVRFWFSEAFGSRLSTTKPKGNKKKADEETEGKVEPPPPAEVESPANAPNVRKSVTPLRFYLNLHLPPVLEYLESRGVSAMTADRYGIGLCQKGVLDGYLAIPVYRWPKGKADENPCGYVGRWPGDDFDAEAGRPRYKVPPGFETSRFIFGLEQALAVGNSSLPLIAVEGCFKAMWLSERGFPNVVSSFTASISEDQAEILIKTAQ